MGQACIIAMEWSAGAPGMAVVPINKRGERERERGVGGGGFFPFLPNSSNLYNL